MSEIHDRVAKTIADEEKSGVMSDSYRLHRIVDLTLQLAYESEATPPANDSDEPAAGDTETWGSALGFITGDAGLLHARGLTRDQILEVQSSVRRNNGDTDQS